MSFEEYRCMMKNEDQDDEEYAVCQYPKCWLEDCPHKQARDRLAKAEKTWLGIKQPLERIIKRTCPCYGMITSLKGLIYCGGCQFIPLRWNKDGIDKFKELEKALGVGEDKHE